MVFNYVCEWLNGDFFNIILDLCCGVGESIVNIVNVYLIYRVIGLDKFV